MADNKNTVVIDAAALAALSPAARAAILAQTGIDDSNVPVDTTDKKSKKPGAKSKIDKKALTQAEINSLSLEAQDKIQQTDDKMSSDSDIQRLLKSLQIGLPITASKIRERFEVVNARDMIYRLRKLGHNIVSVSKKDDKGKEFFQYHLVIDPPKPKPKQLESTIKVPIKKIFKKDLPKPGDDDFIGPLKLKRVRKPKPGDDDFIGPLKGKRFPRPGEDDFIGPLKGKRFPKPGDDDFIGPLKGKRIHIPNPGEDDFIGPLPPKRIFKKDLPKPGDDDFIGPLPAKRIFKKDLPKPGDPDFIGPLPYKKSHYKNNTISKNSRTSILEEILNFSEKMFDETYPLLGKLINSGVKGSKSSSTARSSSVSSSRTILPEQLINTNRLISLSLETQTKSLKLLEEILKKIGETSDDNSNTFIPEGLPGWMRSVYSKVPKSGKIALAAVAAGLAAVGAIELIRNNSQSYSNTNNSTINNNNNNSTTNNLLDQTNTTLDGNPIISPQDKKNNIGQALTNSSDSNNSTPNNIQSESSIAPDKQSTIDNIKKPVSYRPSNTTKNDNILELNAKEIIFKAGKFQFEQNNSSTDNLLSEGGGLQNATYSTSSPVSAQPLVSSPSSSGVSIPGMGNINTPDLTSISTSSGKTAQVDKKYAAQFQGFINDLEGTGYKIDDLSGFSDRQNVNDPSKKSMHAYGAAIDINPDKNPNNSTQTDLPPETAALAKKWGLGWGMQWNSVKDPMHFSAAPSEGGSGSSPSLAQQSPPQTNAGGFGGGSMSSGGGDNLSSSGSSMITTPSSDNTSVSGNSLYNQSVENTTAKNTVKESRETNISEPLNHNTANNPVPYGDNENIDPDDPGLLEPKDASERYNKLFGI